MRNSAPNPLVNVAVSYAIDIRVVPPSEPLFQGVYAAFDALVRGRVGFGECSARIGWLTGSTKSVTRVMEILNTVNTPPDADAEVVMRRAGVCEGSRQMNCWTQVEDRRLLAAIHRYGFSDWSTVARFVGTGRTRAQCSQRWFRSLDPHISKDKWTPEEDLVLLALAREYGEKMWSRVARKLGHRCDVQCRYRYRQIGKKSAWKPPVRRLEPYPAPFEARLLAPAPAAPPSLAAAPVPESADVIEAVFGTGDMFPVYMRFDAQPKVVDNGGVYFVPAFGGLLCPYWRADARGCFMGLTGYSSRGHIARAVLEGIAFQAMDVLACADMPLTAVRVDGGLATLDLLVQFQADVLDIEVRRASNCEATSRGAAITAAYGIGLVDAGIIHNDEECVVFTPSMGAKKRGRLQRMWKKAVARSMDWIEPDDDDDDSSKKKET